MILSLCLNINVFLSLGITIITTFFWYGFLKKENKKILKEKEELLQKNKHIGQKINEKVKELKEMNFFHTENKTIKKPLAVTKFDDGRRYMKFYQKFTSKSNRIYLGYLDLSDSKYDNAEVFDLKICYNGMIEAELYGHENESLGKEFIIVEEM